VKENLPSNSVSLPRKALISSLGVFIQPLPIRLFPAA
jgi:hypothetical protein